MRHGLAEATYLAAAERKKPQKEKGEGTAVLVSNNRAHCQCLLLLIQTCLWAEAFLATFTNQDRNVFSSFTFLVCAHTQADNSLAWN